ncbi:MarR family winged helix-turn-helix transcriptional regulator, partial [Amycolatopsis sp. NPDC004378]
MSPEDWEFWDTWMRAQRLLAHELDRGLQRDCGISKAEFSVLRTLARPMRVGELADALGGVEKLGIGHVLNPVTQNMMVVGGWWLL